jgi:hypothetical protein
MLMTSLKKSIYVMRMTSLKNDLKKSVYLPNNHSSIFHIPARPGLHLGGMPPTLMQPGRSTPRPTGRMPERAWSTSSHNQPITD